MLPDDPDTVVLHVSDMHFEDEDVFGANYESLESYREEAYDRLEDLAAGAGTAWFSGDCGTPEDWRELEGFLEDAFEEYVTIPGNSDTGEEFVEHDEVDDLDELLSNVGRSELAVGDRTYDVMHSHVPQHVGIRKGSSDDRDRYMEDENERGVPHAAEADHDITVTAHYHGEGSFVMEDGKLTFQAGSTAGTYITADELPSTSVQKLYFDGDDVHVQHIDFATGDVVEQRGYRHDGEGFEEMYVDSPWTEDERYG